MIRLIREIRGSAFLAKSRKRRAKKQPVKAVRANSSRLYFPATHDFGSYRNIVKPA
jgi:hypothetical protein